MAKQISFLILSVAILITGIIAFSKLSYYDRSTRILKYNSSTIFEGRMGRGPYGREGHYRNEVRDLSDRKRADFETTESRRGPGIRGSNIPDSLRQQFRTRDGERMGRGSFEGGIRREEGRGRGEFTTGGKISIRNVKWFLAVFAAFTVIAIYLDKAICFIRRR